MVANSSVAHKYYPEFLIAVQIVIIFHIFWFIQCVFHISVDLKLQFCPEKASFYG